MSWWEPNAIIEGDTARPEGRAYFHHDDMEEYRGGGGMWRRAAAADRQRHIAESAELMAQPGKFREAMRRALGEWPHSCSAAFTMPGNQRAWLGRAGCYLATGSPEETTRWGWHTLTATQQAAANRAADAVIGEWRATRSAKRPAQFDLFDPLGADEAARAS